MTGTPTGDLAAPQPGTGFRWAPEPGRGTPPGRPGATAGEALPGTGRDRGAGRG